MKGLLRKSGRGKVGQKRDLDKEKVLQKIKTQRTKRQKRWREVEEGREVSEETLQLVFGE